MSEDKGFKNAHTSSRAQATSPRTISRGKQLGIVSLVFTLLASIIVAIPSPAQAHHKCTWRNGNQCEALAHSYKSRNVTDLTPQRYEKIRDDSWNASTDVNTGRFHWTYATGGRLLDDSAVWSFSKRPNQDPIRGIYKIKVRLPRQNAAVKPTATALYSIEIREEGESNHKSVGQFLIDQRRATRDTNGWVDSGFALVLKSPRNVRITVTDQAAWPDWRDTRPRHADTSRIAVAAIRLEHHSILNEDVQFARARCAANTWQGRKIDLASTTGSMRVATTGSAAISIGLTAVGFAVSAPVGTAVLAILGVADPLSQIVNGEGVLEAAKNLHDARRRLDVTATIGGASFGGRWQRSDRPWTQWRPGRDMRRYWDFGEPGPCERFATWQRYLPEGA